MNPVVDELFEANLEHAAAYQHRFDDVQTSQHPAAVTVCCADARVLQDHLWGNDVPGRLFTCSNIGNRVVQRTATGETVSGDVLYPIRHAGTDTVILVGHTGCGAITAAYDKLTIGVSEPDGIDHCLALLSRRLAAGVESLPGAMDRTAAINHLVEYNVDRQIEFLRAADTVGEHVDIVGVVYDFQDVYSDRRGEVHLVNVNGETDPAVLRAEHPELADRVSRLWTE